LNYVAKYHPHINACLRKHSHLKKRFKNKSEYIAENPIELGESLKHELSGLRSFPFAGNFIIIYIVCDECRQLQHQEKNNCLQCSQIPDNAVIFLVFGPHDATYNLGPEIRGSLEGAAFHAFT